MEGWLREVDVMADMEAEARSALSALKPVLVKAKTILFRPGTRPEGFPIVIHGRIGVYLIGKSGRELLLYSVSRGETCVQTTLGLLGENAYSAEAMAETDLVAVMVPTAVFQQLMATSQAFRGFVFRAFAARVSDVMLVLEQVAFVRIESRIAHALIAHADGDDLVTATHQDIATAIGSVREVVSRHLKTFESRGLVTLERGQVRLANIGLLRQIAEDIG